MLQRKIAPLTYVNPHFHNISFNLKIFLLHHLQRFFNQNIELLGKKYREKYIFLKFGRCFKQILKIINFVYSNYTQIRIVTK